MPITPYEIGEKVRYLTLASNGGTCLVNGQVAAITEREDGYFTVDVFSTNLSGQPIHVESKIVSHTGRSDSISAGHFDSCYDCGAEVNVRDGSGTWRGPRDEVVCRGSIPGTASCPERLPRGFRSLATVNA